MMNVKVESLIARQHVNLLAGVQSRNPCWGSRFASGHSFVNVGFACNRMWRWTRWSEHLYPSAPCYSSEFCVCVCVGIPTPLLDSPTSRRDLKNCKVQQRNSTHTPSHKTWLNWAWLGYNGPHGVRLWRARHGNSTHAPMFLSTSEDTFSNVYV